MAMAPPAAEECQREDGKGHRILLFPAPLKGHLNPMIQLATVLYSKGFTITIFHANLNSPNPSLHTNFHFEPINDGLSDGQASQCHMMEQIALVNTNCREPVLRRLSEMLSEKKGGRIVCVISDELMHFTHEVASHFNLPRLSFQTGSAASVVITSALLVRRKRSSPIQDYRPEDRLEELPIFFVKDLPDLSSIKPGVFDELGSEIEYAKRASAGMIYNSVEELEEDALAKIRLWPMTVFPVGPLHQQALGLARSSLDQDCSCLSWLDKQKPRSILYISYGSIVSIEKQQLVEMAWGIANSEQPFLWVVRPGSVVGSEWVELPEGFEEKTSGKGLIVKWAPQMQVLAHPSVGGFWTHCGWNSILESMSEGVPMLCSPCFWDQKLNARYVSHVWKVGIQVEGEFQRNEVETAIRRLMVEKEGDEIRERTTDLKEITGRFTMKGGSSYRALESLTELIKSM